MGAVNVHKQEGVTETKVATDDEDLEESLEEEIEKALDGEDK